MAMYSFNYDYAHWACDQIEDEFVVRSLPFTEAESKLLRTDLPELLGSDTDMRPAVFGLNNRIVPLLRARIERQKLSPGVRTVKVRRGLTLPEQWDEAYKVIHNTNIPWLVSGVLQNTFLNNVFAQERKPWKSK